MVRARPPRKVEPDRPLLAAGSEQFGRTLPAGVAAVLAERDRIKPRDEAGAVPFGDKSVTVEHRYGLVTVVLPDGARVTGTPDQAAELARLLLATTGHRR